MNCNNVELSMDELEMVNGGFSIAGCVAGAVIKHSYQVGGRIRTAAVCADYIRPDDKILIVDDFLANGEALRGLIALVRSGGASVAGCAVQIEKGFQRGGDRLRESGVKVYSLAIIDEMSPDGGIVFRHP